MAPILVAGRNRERGPITMTRFDRYVLRTTHVAQATEFYEALFGHARSEVVALPEGALARGARPHWLGHLGVPDVEASTRAFVERGATRLGPPHASSAFAILRDPGGAIVALSTPSAEATPHDVCAHVLNTPEVERAKTHYRELFSWDFGPPIDLGAHGVFHPFAFEAGGARVGAFGDIAGRPSVHPHWLFHFRSTAFDHALAVVRSAGGLVIGPWEMPTGERVAVCDDPQGAAFALRDR